MGRNLSLNEKSGRQKAPPSDALFAGEAQKVKQIRDVADG
jgi:hypothetical protein